MNDPASGDGPPPGAPSGQQLYQLPPQYGAGGFSAPAAGSGQYPMQSFPQMQAQQQQHPPPMVAPSSAACAEQLKAFWEQQKLEAAQVGNDPAEFKNHQLPLARIKKIMKSDEDVRMISAEAPVLFAKACEMFILELTLRAWMHAEENKRRTLQRSDIAAAVSRTDILDFLVDVVPREDGRPEEGLPAPATYAASAGPSGGAGPGVSGAPPAAQPYPSMFSFPSGMGLPVSADKLLVPGGMPMDPAAAALLAQQQQQQQLMAVAAAAAGGSGWPGVGLVPSQPMAAAAVPAGAGASMPLMAPSAAPATAAAPSALAIGPGAQGHAAAAAAAAAAPMVPSAAVAAPPAGMATAATGAPGGPPGVQQQ